MPVMDTLFSLKGRRALVTGSARGIGKAAALLLGEAGAEVIFHGAAPSAKLDQTLAEAKAKGIHCKAVAADLATSAGTEELIRQAGETDILILNASVQKYMPLEEFEEEEFLREFQVNLRASFQLCKAFLPGMKSRRFGRVMFLGSVNQRRPAHRLTPYAGTKAAQNVLMKDIAMNYAPFGITANDIVPGVITTDRNAAVLSDPAIVEKLKGIIPARRFGTAEDCAGIMLLLASEAGSYINGESIAVDGGMGL